MFKVGDRVKLVGNFAKGTLGTVVGCYQGRDTDRFIKNPHEYFYVKRDPAGPTDALRYHQSELEKINMDKRHKHADLIIAWANGAKIEYWADGVRQSWLETATPTWHPDVEYRIKPKPDLVRYCEIRQDFLAALTTNRFSNQNVKVVFDGETGELKSVEKL